MKMMNSVWWASIFGVLLCSAAAQGVSSNTDRPNIVFVLLDDVGFRDLGTNVDDSPIPTPFIDSLTARGVHLAQHYVHSVCSPSRASLLTGRYHANTGMTNVLIPGTPAGLPGDIPTLPALLSELGGYSTAMAGKWHLGHAQHKMTPVGRGFDYFTGMYMWDVDSFTKMMYELPWEAPLVIDWVTERRLYNSTEGIPAKDFDGRPYSYTYRHYAEPRHATEAITTAAQEYMHQHAERNAVKAPEEASPLFLYVAYTAAHSPLQPLPRHVAACTHLSHTRRRDFCGMVVGLDEGLRNLTATVESVLGSNTIMVVASDNGGSAFFGGMNAPLRGHKGTPFEGGVRVPAFIVDFTPDQHYLAAPHATDSAASSQSDTDTSLAAGVAAAANAITGAIQDSTLTLPRRTPSKEVSVHYSRAYHGLMHVSDWLPTLLSYAGVPAAQFPARLDGYDFSTALRYADYEDSVSTADICRGDRRNRQSVAISPRAGLLLEMYDAEESVFNQSLSAFRLGDYKLIRGPVRDDNYYYESSTNKINCSHVSLGSMVIETIVDLNDFLFGKGQSDTLNIMMAHLWMPELITLTDTWFPAPTAYINQRNGAIGEEDAGHHEATDLRLYNIAMDPCERYNLAGDPQYAAIIAAIDQEVSAIAAHRPHVLPLDVQLDISLGGAWSKHHVSGDCDINPSIPKEHCRFTHSWVPDDADPMDQKGLMETDVYMKWRTWKMVRHYGTSALGLVGIAVVTWMTAKTMMRRA